MDKDALSRMEFVELTEYILDVTRFELEKEEDREEIISTWWASFEEFDRINIQFRPDPKVDAMIQDMLNSIDRPNPLEDVNCDVQEKRDWWCDLQNGSGLGHMYDHIANYYELIPPFVHPQTRIPENLLKMYSESRWCYVYQLYGACLALSRAIIEVVSDNEYPKEKKNWTMMESLDLLVLVQKLSSDCRDQLRSKVIKPANAVLHDGKAVKSNEAFEAIVIMKEFLEIIYKAKPYKGN